MMATPIDNDATGEHDTLKYSLLGPSLTKSGQDNVDQQKVGSNVILILNPGILQCTGLRNYISSFERLEVFQQRRCQRPQFNSED